MPGPLVRDYRCGTLEQGGHHFEWGTRTYIMGVINVTPDSFSDGGCALDPDRALDLALEMEAAGAAILDVGAESTRPGADAVSASEEWARLQPVLGACRGGSVCPFPSTRTSPTSPATPWIWASRW
jgi:dihydropteroate synthase